MRYKETCDLRYINLRPQIHKLATSDARKTRNLRLSAETCDFLRVGGNGIGLRGYLRPFAETYDFLLVNFSCF